MLAKRVDDLPVGETWIFEPKWDGFRALVFRDRDEIQIQSRDEKPLNRYFPELLDTLAVAVAGALRAGWRDRHRQEQRSRFRSAAAPAASGRIAGEAAVATNPGLDCVFRLAMRRATAICEASRFKSGAARLESLLAVTLRRRST